jgi:uncharacterized protein HemX
MDKYKYQIIALVIALIIGVGVGYLFTSGAKNKEIKKLTEQHQKDLKSQNEEKFKEIKKIKDKVASLDTLRLADSLRIKNLNHQISQRQISEQQLKDKVTKLSTDEKKKWIIDHYSDTN